MVLVKRFLPITQHIHLLIIIHSPECSQYQTNKHESKFPCISEQHQKKKKKKKNLVKGPSLCQISGY